MRWICKEDIEECLNETWRTAAASALARLNDAATCEERTQILGRQSSSVIWRDFYSLLPENLKTKCWYCEAEEIRSDMPIDHFRPKSKVEDDCAHEGYWWLAFDWENYRCACTFCNSRRNSDDSQGGKGCKFPISNPEGRAYSPDADCENENPDFLDPFDPDDWKLLWFDTDGQPEAKPEATEDEQRKVANSVDIFHLHESRIVRARNKIRLDIERAVKQIRSAQESGNNTGITAAKTTLRRMVRDTEKLSRAAIVYLRQHRDLDAVKEILQLD